MAKRDTLMCRHPDRDCPKLLCGYPLPCPWHTAVIDTTVTPATVTIPVTSDAIRQRARLGDIAVAIQEATNGKANA